MKTKIEPYTTVLQQIIVGLEKFGLVSHMKGNPNVFKLMFCKSDVLTWDYETFVSSLSVVWSEQGSNQKVAELATYKAFIEMAEISFHDGKCKLNYWPILLISDCRNFEIPNLNSQILNPTTDHLPDFP